MNYILLKRKQLYRESTSELLLHWLNRFHSRKTALKETSLSFKITGFYKQQFFGQNVFKMTYFIGIIGFIRDELLIICI